MFPSKEQEKALKIPGPVIVVAGPGAGKTHVLVARAIQEAKKGQREILVLTFTRRASGEVRERIFQALGDGKNSITVTTFHSLGFRLVREWGKQIGVPVCPLLSPLQSYERLSWVAEQLGLGSFFPLGDVYRIIMLAKAKPEGAEELRREFPKLYPIYEGYQELLSRQKVMDFSDLIFYLIHFLSHPQIGPQLRSIYSFVLADDFQDFDPALWHALIRFAPNLFLTGSPAQAIFSFRGATPSSLPTFLSLLPHAQHITFTLNYRSTPQIVRGAQELIKGLGYPEENLSSAKKDGPPIKVVLLADEIQESEFVAQTISAFLEHDIPPKDIAVLARTLSRLRVVEQALIRSNIPYILAGDVALFKSPEVQDLLAYLKVAAGDHKALDRILNRPPRFSMLPIFLSRKNIPLTPQHLFSLLPEMEEGDEILKRETQTLREFLSFLQALERWGKENPPAIEVLEWVISKTQYESWVRKSDPLSYPRRLGNIRAFLDFVAQGGENLLEFLATLEVAQEEGYVPVVTDRVTLATIHAAKGQAWKIVFVVGLEEGVLPHYLNPDLSEELRLLYVAMTRAKELLYLVASGSPSRFLIKIEEVGK